MDGQIASFFTKTSAARSACDTRAKELARGGVVLIELQGNCSYSVYAEPDFEYVVQFRLKSLYLKTKATILARKIYGTLAPRISFEGQIGGDIDGKEPLCVYLMNRMPGISYLEFILIHGFPENSQENFARCKSPLADVAHFFALSWKAPQEVRSTHRDHLGQTYVKELRLLLGALPDQFHALIQDFDEESCRLVGVIDWAEAELCPFGLNLDSIQDLMGKLQLRDG
ncbi:hypothetical protein V8C42DRAFT_344454 [Trichoderma barbatum]